MTTRLSRRDFFKAGLGSLAASFALPVSQKPPLNRPRYMRVGEKSGVSIHTQPDERATIVYQRQYNEIITVYDEVIGPNGPGWNPVWYRCWGGFVYSGRLYEVKYELQSVAEEIRAGGQIGEITMPYSRSLFFSRDKGWLPNYLLYYRSIHWIKDIIEGPDGRPWYKILDELNSGEYSVPAEHIRLIADDEYSPLSPDVPMTEKSVQISLGRQELVAYEGDTEVFRRFISSGDPTPDGTYNIQVKMPSKHMGLGELSPWDKMHVFVGVPWNCFFEMKEGMASHGTFWHQNFGTPMSGGCINMDIDDAKWLFRWTTPIAKPGEIHSTGYGTPIHISRN